MDALVAFCGIVVALTIGAMSPGPSFVVVARTSIAASRCDGLAAALGMGAGGVTFGALALLGLQAVMAHVGWLYVGLKFAGGVYLLYLAARLWLGAAKPLAVPPPQSGQPTRAARSFVLGLTTQLSNPKTAIVYAGIFAALLPAAAPTWLYAALPVAIFLIETGWYAIVAVVFSSARPRAMYLRSKAWIDRAAGVVIAALGVRLIVDASPAA